MVADDTLTRDVGDAKDRVNAQSGKYSYVHGIEMVMGLLPLFECLAQTNNHSGFKHPRRQT